MCGCSNKIMRLHFFERTLYAWSVSCQTEDGRTFEMSVKPSWEYPIRVVSYIHGVSISRVSTYTSQVNKQSRKIVLHM